MGVTVSLDLEGRFLAMFRYLSQRFVSSTETIYAKVGNRAINKELTKIMSIYWDFSISFVCPLSSDVTRARFVRWTDLVR